VKVELSAEASAQVEKIDAWWRKNRLAAPEMFILELGNALTTLEETPTLGTPYTAGGKKVRRLLLRRTRYHLYFIEQKERLFVVAVWSPYRGRAPRL
jgi:plasmid stabilization system protein ParE